MTNPLTLRSIRAWSLACIAFLLGTESYSLAQPSRSTTFGTSLEELNGPWKFHIGDDPAWSRPGFNDSGWETIDLTAKPGAHDTDVGLSGYVSGWAARGHRGYSGFAWYRLRLSIAAFGQPLALTGPPAVDSTYQLFVDGRLLGGCGRFSSPTPVAFSVQPRLLALPFPAEGSLAPRSVLIAFRVWMGPWALADSGAGGIRIAPALGLANSAELLYEHQWAQTICGYVVEVLEATAFLILAALAFALAGKGKSERTSGWLAVALVLTAFFRLNQAIFFWAQVESVQSFEMISIVLLIPLCLGAWTLTWSRWVGLERKHWIERSCAALTFLYIAAEFMTRSWFQKILPGWLFSSVHIGVTWIRLLFLSLMIVIIWLGVRRWPKDGWAALLALALVSIGQYAQELSAIGVPGIWFLRGIGVSRTQFVYAAFAIFLFSWFLMQINRFFEEEHHCETSSP